MRVDKPIAPLTQPQKITKNETNQNGSFQQILEQSSVKKTEDTITIYSRESMAMETAVAAPALTILPSDSIDMKLEKLKAIAETADYTGKSYKEIYKTIWDRYNNAFGGNMFAMKTLWAGDYGDINNQFVQELMHNVHYPLYREITAKTGLQRGDSGFSDYAEPIIREASAEAYGYSGMDYDEIEAAIRQKYQGKDTFLDFFNMQGELFYTGVMNHKMGSQGALEYISALNRQVDYSYNSESAFGEGPRLSQTQINSLLHQKFDSRRFFSEFRATLANTSFSNFKFNIEDILSNAINDMAAIMDRQEDGYR